MKILATISVIFSGLVCHGQIIINGVMDSTEGYQLIGEYTKPISPSYGFITKLSYANSQEKLYLFLEGGGIDYYSIFAMYLNVPSRFGIQQGDHLPYLQTGNWFSTYPPLGNFYPIMDFEVDYAFWIFRDDILIPFVTRGVVDYTVDSVPYERNLPAFLDSFPTSLPDSTLRMAYSHYAVGSTFPGKTGWEIEMDLAQFGINDKDSLEVFCLVKDYFDFSLYGSFSIPELPYHLNPSGPYFGFDTIPGEQFVRFGINNASGPVNGILGVGYTLLSEYSIPASDPNFGESYGIIKLYARQTQSHVYFLVAGTAENGVGHLVFYLDNPDLPGIPAGQQLPVVDQAFSLFQEARPVMDMETDFAFALSPNATGAELHSIDYTQLAGGQYQSNFMGSGLMDGTPMFGIHQADSGQMQFTRFDSMQSAYYEISNIFGNDGTIGWETGIKKSSLGITKMVDSISIFAAYLNNNGVLWTSKVLPEVPGMVSNIGNNPDFNQLIGNQYVKYKVNDALNPVTGETSLTNKPRLNVFPNPAMDRLYVKSEKIISGNYKSMITDLSGRVHNCGTIISDDKLELDTTHLPNGMYLLTLLGQDQMMAVKFIVNR